MFAFSIQLPVLSWFYNCWMRNCVSDHNVSGSPEMPWWWWWWWWWWWRYL